MRAQHVATNEDVLFAGEAIVLVGLHQAVVVVELLQTGEVDCLTNRGNDQVGRQIMLGAFDDLGFLAFHHEIGHAQRGCTAIRALDHGDRGHTADDFDTFSLGMLDFVLVGIHLVDGGTGNQHHFGAFTGRDGADVMSHLAGHNDSPARSSR